MISHHSYYQPEDRPYLSLENLQNTLTIVQEQKYDTCLVPFSVTPELYNFLQKPEDWYVFPRGVSLEYSYSSGIIEPFLVAREGDFFDNIPLKVSIFTLVKATSDRERKEKIMFSLLYLLWRDGTVRENDQFFVPINVFNAWNHVRYPFLQTSWNQPHLNDLTMGHLSLPTFDHPLTLLVFLLFLKTGNLISPFSLHWKDYISRENVLPLFFDPLSYFLGSVSGNIQCLFYWINICMYTLNLPTDTWSAFFMERCHDLTCFLDCSNQQEEFSESYWTLTGFSQVPYFYFIFEGLYVLDKNTFVLKTGDATYSLIPPQFLFSRERVSFLWLHSEYAFLHAHPEHHPMGSSLSQSQDPELITEVVKFDTPVPLDSSEYEPVFLMYDLSLPEYSFYNMIVRVLQSSMDDPFFIYPMVYASLEFSGEQQNMLPFLLSEGFVERTENDYCVNLWVPWGVQWATHLVPSDQSLEFSQTGFSLYVEYLFCGGFHRNQLLDRLHSDDVDSVFEVVLFANILSGQIGPLIFNSDPRAIQKVDSSLDTTMIAFLDGWIQEDADLKEVFDKPLDTPFLTGYNWSRFLSLFSFIQEEILPPILLQTIQIDFLTLSVYSKPIYLFYKEMSLRGQTRKRGAEEEHGDYPRKRGPEITELAGSEEEEDGSVIPTRQEIIKREHIVPLLSYFKYRKPLPQELKERLSLFLPSTTKGSQLFLPY